MEVCKILEIPFNFLVDDLSRNLWLKKKKKYIIIKVKREMKHTFFLGMDWQAIEQESPNCSVLSHNLDLKKNSELFTQTKKQQTKKKNKQTIKNKRGIGGMNFSILPPRVKVFYVE